MPLCNLIFSGHEAPLVYSVIFFLSSLVLTPWSPRHCEESTTGLQNKRRMIGESWNELGEIGGFRVI